MDWKVRAFTLILWLGLVLASIQHGNAEKRVVCYYTNWSVYRPGTAKFSPQNINPYLCTHLIYAFGGFTKENTLRPFDKYQDIEKGGYAKFTGLKTYNKNLKTLLAIGGWNEGSSRFSPMVADARRRKEFVKNCVKFLRQNHFDGLDLDWEYPAFRDGGKPHDKENYALLVEELREQFERESSKTGRTRLLLTMAMPAGIEYIDKGYDVPRLNENLDFINLLSYDYHSAFEPAVNHHSPLYPLEEDNEYNYDTELTIEYTINHLIEKGASPEKIVLGIPTYGRSYTLFNEDSTEIGSPADGPGIEGDATREKGYLAYYEICENVQKGDWEVIHPNPEAMGPYAFKENQWVGYDDENIMRVKAQYVNEKNLGGIMFWSIDNDDFRGKCHGRPYPLIEAAKEALFSGSSKRQEVKEKTTIKKPSKTQSSQSNTSGRPYSSANRRTSTTESTTRKRLGSPKSKNKLNAGESEDKEDGEETVHLEVEEEEINDDRNAVRTNDKPTRSRFNSKNRPRSRATEDSGRKKQKNRDNKLVEDSNVEESFSNKFTTPEPPTTPDPGADFKCQDEGFFSHPRDCKKYFWCLDSGPSGLGIVGHQFTCPSGLVFNKAADSCDYPRNVICPKVKSESEVKTTRATTVATITQFTTTRRTTTEKPEPEEEYEYEEEDDVEEEEEPPKTTAKPLIYKTISRNRPSSTTPSTATTAKAYQENFEKSTELAEEEDPRVIKELLDLIKKAGGIEHLEKQLLLQEKHTGGSSGTTAERGQATPATISRTLYERVLNRQGSRVGSRFFGTSSPKSIEHKGKEEKEGNNRSRIGYTNGPGQARFDGLDDLPEVKSLRRTNKPKYTTIERSSSSKPSSSDRIDDSEDEGVTDDNTDVASSEEKSISNPPDDKTLLPRVTPSYVSIRRNHPATISKDENDVNVKEEAEEDRPSTRRRFVFTTRTEKTFSEKEDPKPQRSSSIADLPDEVQSPTESEKSVTRTIFPNRNTDESSNPKSRYISIQRFRSTTEESESNQSEDQVTASTPRVTIQTETTSSTSRKDTSTPAPGSSEIPYTISMSYSQSSLSSSLSTSPLTTITTSTTTTENPTTLQNTFDDQPVFRTEITNPTRSSYLGVKLVGDSESETFLSTLPFSSSPTTAMESTTKVNLAPVTQPRPFGFTRSRSRPSLTQTSSFLDSTTALSTSTTVPSRSKMASFLLPTLKQLIGHPSYSSFNFQEDNIVGVTQPSIPFSKGNSLRRSFDEKPDLVDDPKQILDDTHGDTNELLELRVPKKKDNSLELEENIVNRNLVTNELLSMKQSEFLSEAEKISITESTPSDESNATVIPSTTSSLPSNPRVADIERAKRRRMRKNYSQATTGSIHKKPRVETRRLSRKRNRISAPGTTTTIRVTTSRGSTLPPPPTTNFLRGFLLTRNIDEVLITKKINQVSTAGIQQSTDPSTVSTTEATSTYSTKAMESFPDTTTEYSESSTSTNSRFNGNRNQEEESVSNLYETTTEIARKNEEVNYSDTFSPDDYSNQSLETTTESFGTTISNLEENNDTNYGHTLLNTVIVYDTEEVTPLPQSYLRRNKIKRIKPVSSVEDSTTKSFTHTTEDSSYFTHYDPTTITIMDSTLSYITSPPTTLDLTSCTQISDLTTLDFASESPISTTEASLRELSTISDNLVASDRTGLNFTDISDYSIKLISQFKNIFSKYDDSIKPTPKSVKLNTDRTDSFTTIPSMENFQTTTYEPEDLEKLESKGAIEIKDKDITIEKGFDSTILPTLSQLIKADSTTPSSKHQISDENDTATSFTKSSTVITNQSLLAEAKVNSPSLGLTTDESVPKNKRPTANGRKRVVKRKRQKIGPTLDNKNIKVSKTEAIEVTLEKNEEKSTTPATVISTKTTPETEKPTRKRIGVNRGTIKFTFGTTASSMAVESSPNIRDHPNQIVSRRNKKIVRKRPKLPTTNIPETNLNTSNNQSDSNGKQLSLDPEIKTYDDTDEAGSEVNVYRSLAVNSRRPAPFHHREPNRSRSRTSIYQPSTSTQAAPRRFGSLSALRQTLLAEETTMPSKKLSLVSGDDSAILLKQLTKQQDQRAEMDDQTNRAHEIMLEPETNLSTTEPGDSSFRRPFWRKISTTETPRTLGTTAILASRRQQGQKYFNRVVSQNLSQNLPQKPRRPAIVDYDYYEDEEERFVGKPSLNGKLYVTSRGSIRCLEQGNFPHPSSCKKFITCARMVNGLIVGTEYKCPDKLSFDPIGGICNWSAGLGCKE